MKHERDHEKRVVLEDIPSDDTMISSLALCEKEQMAVSSYFVDRDEDINVKYDFEDEHQLPCPEHEKRTWAIYNEYWCHQHFGSPLSG